MMKQKGKTLRSGYISVYFNVADSWTAKCKRHEVTIYPYFGKDEEVSDLQCAKTLRSGNIS